MGNRIGAAAVLVVIALAAANGAGAHDDPTPDPQRCDSWWRAPHGTGSGGNNYPSHDHDAGSDVEAGPADIHGHSGHYGVRTDVAYVEVVGGQAYRGPHPAGNDFPGQGGYVQGEIDAGNGAPDADFNVAFFGPDVDHPPSGPGAVAWVQGTYAAGCLNVAGQQVEQQSREP